mmetsp:Transcript_31085/g.54590  ORF Transcript_31085/g.54590 Transcript_31085/m.54590 type:complete len:326 (-) Transcript_31085:110-1087(-)
MVATGDAIMVLLLAAMAEIGRRFDLANIIPGLADLEYDLRLRRGVSDVAAKNLWPIFTGVSIAYLLLLTVGQDYMSKRKPFKFVKPLLPIWFFIIWMFSFAATAQLGQGIAMHVKNANFDPNLGPFGLIHQYIIDFIMNADEVLEAIPEHRKKMAWLTLFCYSKPFEFIDTVLLVLSKKPVSRLHWVHHLVTMWFSWMNLAVYASPGLLFAVVNAFVHSVMYCWYFLAALKMKPKSLAIVVTAIQNLQMFVGVLVPVMSYHHREKCQIPDIYWVFTVAMYTLYIFMFGHLFITKYIFRTRTSLEHLAANQKASAAKKNGSVHVAG